MICVKHIKVQDSILHFALAPLAQLTEISIIRSRLQKHFWDHFTAWLPGTELYFLMCDNYCTSYYTELNVIFN